VTLQRDTYGRAQSEQEAQQFWGQPRHFFIPAFPMPLDEIYRLGIRWLQQPPGIQSGPVTDFEPVIVAAEDVPVWAEFLVVALEAERKDQVKTVNFQLEMAEPLLWVLP
jgi:hypothetical protein